MLYAFFHQTLSDIEFKVDRLQIIVVAKQYIYVSQLFISRVPKMRAIPQYGFGSIKSYTNFRTF